MPPKGAKRPRLASLQRVLGFCSDRKLADIVDSLVVGVEAGSSLNRRGRRSIAEDLNDEARHLLMRAPVKLNDGGEAVWEFFEPNRLLAHVVESCLELAEAYGRAANEHMPTREQPWDLLMCFDEFAPVDTLKCYNDRKSMVLGYNSSSSGKRFFLTIIHG